MSGDQIQDMMTISGADVQHLEHACQNSDRETVHYSIAQTICCSTLTPTLSRRFLKRGVVGLSYGTMSKAAPLGDLAVSQTTPFPSARVMVEPRLTGAGNRCLISANCKTWMRELTAFDSSLVEQTTLSLRIWCILRSLLRSCR